MRYPQEHRGPPRKAETLTRSFMDELEGWIPPKLYLPLRRRLIEWIEHHVVAEERRVRDTNKKRIQALLHAVRTGALSPGNIEEGARHALSPFKPRRRKPLRREKRKTSGQGGEG